MDSYVDLYGKASLETIIDDLHFTLSEEDVEVSVTCNGDNSGTITLTAADGYVQEYALYYYIDYQDLYVTDITDSDGCVIVFDSYEGYDEIDILYTGCDKESLIENLEITVAQEGATSSIEYDEESGVCLLHLYGKNGVIRTYRLFFECI